MRFFDKIDKTGLSDTWGILDLPLPLFSNYRHKHYPTCYYFRATKSGCKIPRMLFEVRSRKSFLETSSKKINFLFDFRKISVCQQFQLTQNQYSVVLGEWVPSQREKDVYFERNSNQAHMSTFFEQRHKRKTYFRCFFKFIFFFIWRWQE